jgi:hypothetical protein
MMPASRVIAEFSRKSAPHAKFNAARKARKNRRRQILMEPDLRQHVDDNRSAAAGAGESPLVFGCAGRERRIR